MLAIGLKDFDFLKALRVQVFIYLCFHYFVMRFKIGFLFWGDGFLFLGVFFGVLGNRTSPLDCDKKFSLSSLINTF